MVEGGNRTASDLRSELQSQRGQLCDLYLSFFTCKMYGLKLGSQGFV